MELSTGAHQLVVAALHPSGRFTTNASAWFTNNLAQEAATVYRDRAGNITKRIWRNPDGTTNRMQTLWWDVKERLEWVMDYDSQRNGYFWYADYDALDRRVRTRYYAMTNGVGVPYTAGITNIEIYDPLVEFLQVGVSVNGTMIWKLSGPDLNGKYGGMNGTGGFEATVADQNQVQIALSDVRGNVLGAVTNGVIAWNSARPTGYGAVAGRRPLPLGHGGNLIQSSAWRGRYTDPSGWVNLGKRYYDPVAGSFISVDPVWSNRDPNYHSFAGGDPINYFDPDGRFGKTVAKGVDSVWNWAVSTAFTPNPEGATEQQRQALANIVVENFGSPLRRLGAYDPTPMTRAFVEELPSQLSQPTQDAMMSYAASRGTVQTPIVQLPQNQTVQSPGFNAYEAWRQDTQPQRGIIDLNPPRQQSAAPQPITILGSAKDVAPYANQPGFNVLRMPDSVPKAQWDAYNAYWLMNAYTRGDSFWLVTDPVAFSQILQAAKGTENVSAYFRVELPILDQFNVRQNAVPAYNIPGGPPLIPPQRR